MRRDGVGGGLAAAPVVDMRHPSRPLATFALATLAACVEAPVDDPALEELGEAEQPISGIGTSFTAGIVGIAPASNPLALEPALVIAHDLIYVHERWARGAAPRDLRVVEHNTTGQQSVTRSGRFVNHLGPGSVLQLDGDLTPRFALDTRNDAALQGVPLRCIGYGTLNGNTTQLALQVTVTGDLGDHLAIDVTQGRIDPGDQGVVCFDNNPSRVAAVGMIDVGASGVPTLRPYRVDATWIERMRALADVRTAPGATAFTIATRYLLGNPAGGVAAVDSCLDVPDASPYPGVGVNYYPCHGRSNQRFWRQPTVDPIGFRLVADHSGLCLGVPGGAMVSGTNLQQLECHNGLSQRWTILPWGTSLFNVTNRVSPGSDQSQCLSVDGWARAAVRPVEQRSCPPRPQAAPPYDQAWQLRVAP